MVAECYPGYCMNYTSSHLPIDSTRNSFDLPGITDTRRVKTIPCEINILRDNYANSCNIRVICVAETLRPASYRQVDDPEKTCIVPEKRRRLDR